MRKKLTALAAILMVTATIGLAPTTMRPQADLGGLVGSYWGAIGAAVGAVAGGVVGGLAGSAIAPGPGSVIGEMSGSDLGMLVGGA